MYYHTVAALANFQILFNAMRADDCNIYQNVSEHLISIENLVESKRTAAQLHNCEARKLWLTCSGIHETVSVPSQILSSSSYNHKSKGKEATALYLPSV